MSKRLFLDFETNKGAIEKELTNVFCCSLKPSDSDEIFTITEGYKDIIQEYLDEGYTPVAHNFGFDGWVMKELGIKYTKYHDTMVLHYLLHPMDSHSLADIGQSLGIQKLEFKDFDDGYSEEMKTYCERDVEILEKAFNTYFPQLMKDSKLLDLYINVELPIVELIMETECNGVAVDVEQWESIIKEVETQRQQKDDEIQDLLVKEGCNLVLGKKSKTKNDRKPEQVSDVPELGMWKLINKDEEFYHWAMWECFNSSSPSQVVEVFNKLGIEIDKSGKDVLNEIDHPLATLLLEYRKLDKLASAFGTKMLDFVKDGRIHPSYNQCVTLTGRLSCSKPNLQQIPSHGESGEALRKLFVASAGHKLVSIDIDAFQMRIYAWYLHEMCPTMPDAHALYDDFNDTSKKSDPHQAKADLMNVPRSVGKTLNFATLFGASPKKAAQTAGCSVEEMQGYFEIQKEKFPSDEELKRLVQTYCKRNKGYLYDLYGRRGYYPHINSNNWSDKGRAERQAFNFLIQGTEASIVKQMWLLAWKLSKHLEAKPVLQVHDEFTFEVPESNAEALASILNQVVNDYSWLPGLKVTGSATIGDNWHEVH